MKEDKTRLEKAILQAIDGAMSKTWDNGFAGVSRRRFLRLLDARECRLPVDVALLVV